MLGKLHPLPKMALCLVWIGASVLIFDLRFQLATLGFAFGLLWIVERLPLWKLLALLVPFALFGFGFFTTSVLFNRESGFALQMAGEAILARPDFAPGLVLFTRALACGMVSALFVLTTDPGRLIRALMTDLRLPATVGFALMQAMHLVPDLAREFQILRMARAMRADKRLRRSPRIGETLGLAIPLLAFAIRRASRAAIAMEARGLRHGAPRTHMQQPGPTRHDLFATVIGFAALFGLIAAI